MGFNFIKYVNSAGKDNGIPRCTIRKSGQLALSQTAVSLLGNATHAYLYYDKEANVIGIEPHPEGSHKIHNIKKLGWYIHAAPFLRYFGCKYSPEKYARYRAEWSDEYKMLLVYLNKPV